MAEAKPKLLRNLTRYTLRLRFGSSKDPFHVQLQPRGLRGDVGTVPAAFAQHPTFDSNVGRSFEVITAAQAKRLAENYPEIATPRHSAYDDLTVTLERDSDNERTVATYEQTTVGGKETLRRTRSDNFEPERASVPGSQDHAASDVPKRRNKAENASTDMPPFKGVERVKS